MANLARAGDHRHLIAYVERWATYAEPTPDARLAQAGAFLALRQVDRAWIRLKDLLDTDDAGLDVLLTATRLFLVRGWPSKAREVLTRALADHPDDARLQQLWDDASSDAVHTEPPTAPDADGPDGMLPIAEHYLATGQSVSGRQILERLRKTHPDHPRIGDLLWGMDGDFDAGPATLATLTERYAPSLASLQDLSDEHTESVTQEDAKQLLDEPEAADGPFPDLFRNPAPKGAFEDEITEEITRTAEMLRPRLPDGDATDTADDGPGDTRIVRVVNRGGPAPSTVMHRASPRPDNDFDLGEYQREMGMTPTPLHSHLASDFGADLEDEDDDLVVLTRRERPVSTEADTGNTDPTLSQIGREVAHLVGGRQPRPPDPPIASPDPMVTTPVPEPVPTPDSTPAGLHTNPAPVLDDLELDPDTDDAPVPRPGRTGTAVWLVVLATVLLLGTGAVVALAAGIALF